MLRFSFPVLAGLLTLAASCAVDTSPLPMATDGGPGPECRGDDQCDDGIACTVDTCVSGSCEFVPSDDLCMGEELCRPTLAADPTSGCYARTCDEAACADAVGGADTCTAGECVEGRCEEVSICDLEGAGVDASCVEPGCTGETCSEFVHLAAGTSCNNGVFCDGDADTCDGAGHCVGGDNPCEDECNEELGCVGCTLDEHCPTLWSGECTWAVPDGDRCVADSGSELGRRGTCSEAGACLYETTPTDSRGCSLGRNEPCDDGTTCTTGDICTSGGVCAGTPSNITCDDFNVCTRDVCNPSSGSADDDGCVFNNRRDGYDCDTSDTDCQIHACTAGTCRATTETCSGMGDQCNDDVCVVGTGCTTEAVSGRACEDGDMCTEGDTCNAGSCRSGSAVTCDLGGADPDCNTIGACVPATGCPAPQRRTNGTACGDVTCEGRTCQSGSCSGVDATYCDGMGLDDTCNAAYCDVGSGSCASTPTNEGGACDDGDMCTTGETCGGGSCGGGSAVVCPAPSGADADCLQTSCNSGSGCGFTNTNGGGACDDGDFCTVTSECSAGTCGSTLDFDVSITRQCGGSIDEGETCEFEVVLNGQPDADVVVRVSNNRTAQASLDLSELTFTTGNWDTPQTVTLTGTEDGVDDSNTTITVTAAASECGGVSSTATVRVDNVTAMGVDITTLDGSASEATWMENAQVGVVLLSSPSGMDTVTVDLTLSPAGQGYFWDGMNSVATWQLSFSDMNWDTRQDVNVYATDDSDMDGTVTVTVTATASGGGAAIDGTVDTTTYDALDNE